MSREWKPGDVAVLGSVNGEAAVGFAVGVGEVEAWRTEDGTLWGPNYTVLARPLVVIDPEDREQAARLIALFSDQFTSWSTDGERDADKMQAALREFANPTPPLPDEPPPWSVAVVAGATPFTRIAKDHITAPYSASWFGEHPRTGERVRLTWGELHALGEVEIVGRGVGL